MHPLPIALHGGSGLTADQFHDLIARGCAKVNISTALKERYMKANLAFLEETAGQGQVGSSVAVRRGPQDCVEMAVELMQLFGSSGKAA